jgi:hypothetical protein
VYRLNGKILDNQPMSIDHKVEFELELRWCIREMHRQLALRTRAQVLCKVLFETDFLDGVVFKGVMVKSRDFYHNFVFPNFVVLKAMDEKGGCLNYTAIEILQYLEGQYWIRAGLFEKKRFK